jgi:hypothetical protein
MTAVATPRSLRLQKTSDGRDVSARVTLAAPHSMAAMKL